MLVDPVNCDDIRVVTTSGKGKRQAARGWHHVMLDRR